MHTEWTLVCLSFLLSFHCCPLGLDDSANPLITNWYTHTCIHTHARSLSHITQQNISSNYWFSINNFPRFCARQKILIAIRLPCFVKNRTDSMQSLWVQDMQIVHWLAAWWSLRLICWNRHCVLTSTSTSTTSAVGWLYGYLLFWWLW